MSDSNDMQVLTEAVSVYTCPSCRTTLDLSGHPAFTSFTCSSCGTTIQVPARLGGFLLLEFLGAGGMGSAYRARDVSLNRDVAIKVMRKSYGDDPAFVDAFRHEAQATAVLNHPNVVQIYSFGSAHGQPFLVMELVRGGSLHEMIMRGVKLDQSTVMRIAGDVATGLQHGYQFHLVHGDIKPENILLDVKGTAKIVDFGIAQLAGRNATEVWGTPYYVAPETVRRQRTDCRADIYSLGGTIFHALAGKPPFDGEDTTAVVKARFMTPAPPLRELRPDIDPEIETIVARMLQVDPVMRYPTYESLLGDIQHYLDRVKASAGNARKTGKIVIRAGATSTGHLPAMPPEKPKRRWLIYLLLGVGVLGLAGAGFVAWRFLKHQNYVAPLPPPTASAIPVLQVRQEQLARIVGGADVVSNAAVQLAAWAVDGSRYLTQATNSVAGLLTGEERDQLAPPRPVVGTETSSAPVEVESEPAGLPPVVVTIRRMYRDQYRLETLPLSASAESASIRQEAMQASSATNVLELLSQMDAGLAARVGSYTTGSVMREAKEKLADLKQGAYGVAAMAVTLAEQKQRREQEARRQIEASNALVRAQQEEAARQKLIASEMASVQTREHEFLDRVHHGEYNDVRLFLVAMQPSLTTEEGLRALHTAIERVNRMESLHKFVIDYIAGYQNKNGWKIVSADNDGVLVSNQNITKSVSWNDLGEVRLILFFNYLLMDEEGSAKVRLRERVNQLINASMYCKQFLTSNSDAQENAGKMLAKAIALLPDAVIDIERLIPGGMGKTPDASGAAASTTNQVGAESAAAKQP